MPTAQFARYARTVCALRAPLSPSCLEILSLHGCKEADQKPEDAAGKDIDDRVSRSEAPQPEEAQTERNLRTHHPFLDLNGRRDRQGHRKNTTDPKRQAEVNVRAQRLQHWRKD